MADKEGSLGICIHDDRELVVSTNQSEKEMLDTIIHEIIHAEFPKASEKVVTVAANDISNALWRIGYRVLK